jgi:hypothetical protein
MPVDLDSNCPSERSTRLTFTPDKETGLGNHSDRDFLNEVHRGTSRAGARLHPAMTETSCSYLTDADGLAMKACGSACRRCSPQLLKTRWRSHSTSAGRVACWSALFNPDTRFEPDPAWRPD